MKVVQKKYECDFVYEKRRICSSTVIKLQPDIFRLLQVMIVDVRLLTASATKVNAYAARLFQFAV